MEKALEENMALQELTVIIGERSAQLHHLLESVLASGTLETLCLKGVSSEYVLYLLQTFMYSVCM